MLDLSTRSGYGCKFVWDTRLSFKSCALRSKLVPFCVVAERSERARASPSGGTAISRACEFRHVIETDAPAYVQRGSGSLPSCTRRVCLAAALTGLSVVQQAHAEQGLNRYIRKRKLDPLDTYVPSVLRAKSQLIEVGNVMVTDPTEARIMLRGGAFTGLRDSVKAMGEYATQSGLESNLAAKMVSDFFSAVESLDFALFDAIRNEQPLAPSASKSVDKAILALDRLVATVPGPLLEKSRRVAEAGLPLQSASAPGAAPFFEPDGGGGSIPPPLPTQLLPEVPPAP